MRTGRRLAAACAAGLGLGTAVLPAAAVPVVPVILVTASPATVTTAQFVDVTATFYNMAGGAWGRDGWYQFQFGDGRSVQYGFHPLDPEPLPCQTEMPTPDDPGIAETRRHAYRRPGRYVITVQFHKNCGMDSDGTGPIFAGTTTIEVLPGPDLSNGPTRPELTVTMSSHKSWPARTHQAHLAANDYDGFFRSPASIDWGDRTSTTSAKLVTGPCVEDPAYYPEGHGDTNKGAPKHTYKRPGRYRVTVTLTSTGCDGMDPQRVTVSSYLTVR